MNVPQFSFQLLFLDSFIILNPYQWISTNVPVLEQSPRNKIAGSKGILILKIDTL